MSDKDEKNYWWQVGLKMFAESSGWIALPVVGALFVGRWLDSKYNSQPIFFLSLTGLAFIISSIGITLSGIKYIKLLDKDKDKFREEKAVSKEKRR